MNHNYLMDSQDSQSSGSENFDEFAFWCNLLETNAFELINMSEEEVNSRMDAAYGKLRSKAKRKPSLKRNFSNFLENLNNYFGNIESVRSNNLTNFDIPVSTKEKLNPKLRQKLFDRGGFDVVNALENVNPSPRKPIQLVDLEIGRLLIMTKVFDELIELVKEMQSSILSQQIPILTTISQLSLLEVTV